MGVFGCSSIRGVCNADIGCGCPSTADDRERGLPTPLHLQFTPHRGACGKPRVVPHNRRPQPRTYGNGEERMRVLLSTHLSRGDVEPMVGLAEQSRALRAEGCGAVVATGVTPAAVSR